MKSDLIDAEKVKLLYDGLPGAVLVNALLALTLATVQVSVITPAHCLIWLALLGLAQLVRVGLLLAWRRDPLAGTANVRAWLGRFRSAVLVTGVVWGASSFLLFPSDNTPYQVFLSFVIAGIGSGAITTLAIDRASTTGFMVPMMLPLVVRLMLEHGEIPVAMSVMSALFLFFMLASAARSRKVLHENVRLRVEAGANAQALSTAKDAAEAANRAKSEFLGSMSHELRTPLNAIQGFAQLLQMEAALPADAHANAREIERAGKHLLSLINDLIDLSRIETGKMDLSMEPVPVQALLADSLTMVASLARDKGVTLIRARGDDPLDQLTVHADYVRLRQVLINFLSNAIKYNRPQGTVTVCCQQHAHKLRIAVSDTGLGIAPEKQQRLFHAFDRLGAELGSVEGTGIGLVITQRIVQAMGGTLGFESTPGQGSSFWVELTVCEPAAVPASAPGVAAVAPPAAPAAGHKRLLLAEDNPVNQRLAVLMLKKIGYEADVVPDGAQAVHAVAQGDYGAVLMDCQMPVMDGFKATTAIRLAETGTLRHIPVIAMTANAMQGDRERCLAAGMDDYTTKPINTQRLQELLKRWLPVAEVGAVPTQTFTLAD